MISISTQDINKLRQHTGAGMLACKKALVECNGDFDLSIDYLRKKGQNLLDNRQDKEATEGCIFSKVLDNTYGIILEINCETDFVSRSNDFQKLGQDILNLCISKNIKSLDELKEETKNLLHDVIIKTGEKLYISKYNTLEGDYIASYIHPGARIGVLVKFNMLTDIGKDICMQIVAMNPLAVNKDTIDSNILNKEIEISNEQARATGKPEAIVEKITEGKLQKFFKENTLIKQEFVKDSSKTVEQYMKENNKDLEVISFIRFQLGS